MIKRGMLVLALVVLLIPIAIADDEIFDRDVVDFETFVLEGMNYTPLYYPDRGQLWLSVLQPDGQKENLIIENCTDIGYRQYCLSDYEEDYDEVYGETFSRVRLTVQEWSPDITIKRDFDPSEPEINEEVTVSTTIKNDGREGVKVQYHDQFPPFVSLRSGDFDRATNTYRWSDFIDGYSERTFTYRIYFTEMKEYTGQPHITYDFDGKNYTINGNKKTVKVEVPYEMKITVEPERVVEGKEISYTANIENVQEKNLEILRLKVEVPSGLKVLDQDGLKTDMTKSFELYENEDHEFTLVFEAEKKGVYTIWTDIDFAYDGKRFHTREAHNISVGISDIETSIEFPTDSYRGCPTIPVKITLHDGKNRLQVNKVDLSSNLLPNRGWNNIDVTGSHDLIDQEFQAPCAEDFNKYYISIDGKQRYNDMDFWFTGTRTLVIRPLVHLLNITHSVQFSEKEATVTVDVTNPGSTVWNLTISDHTGQDNVFFQPILKENETMSYNYTIRTTSDINISNTYTYWKGTEMSEWHHNQSFTRPFTSAKEETKALQKPEPAKKPATTEETEKAGDEEKKTLGNDLRNLINAIIKWFSE